MSYPATQTYWLESTQRIAVGLRRYSRSDGDGWTCETGYHSALVFTGDDDVTYKVDREDHRGRLLAARPDTPHDDPRWPATCRCGYEFTDEDAWQDWQEVIYQRLDTGDLMTLRQRQASDVGGPAPAPPGAMWDAWWMPASWAGSDGIALMVRCPNGHDWHVDGRAKNCTLPNDHLHKCWVRHGDPRAAEVTVDKNGNTCAAGAGSIQAGDYHGFLQAGVLTAG